MRWNIVRMLPALASLALPAAGGESTVQMGVSASVMPRTDIRVDVPVSLVITREDLRRGLLAPQALRVRAWSNTPHGLELTVQAPEGLFASLRVQGPGVDARLPGDGGSFAWRWPHRPGFQAPASVDLEITAELAAGARAGKFGPLHLAGRALDQ